MPSAHSIWHAHQYETPLYLPAWAGEKQRLFTDPQKTDIRRHCGYPAYGASPAGNMGWRFYTAYGALEYRMNNLSAAEEAVALMYLTNISQLESAVPCSSDNLDTEAAAAWTHNVREIDDRLRLLDEWRKRLCGFLGIPVGEGLSVSGLSWRI